MEEREAYVGIKDIKSDMWTQAPIKATSDIIYANPMGECGVTKVKQLARLSCL
jgi:hypothetical protein